MNNKIKKYLVPIFYFLLYVTILSLSIAVARHFQIAPENPVCLFTIVTLAGIPFVKSLLSLRKLIEEHYYFLRLLLLCLVCSYAMVFAVFMTQALAYIANLFV